MDSADPTPDAQPYVPPRWGLASAAMPVVGFFDGMLVVGVVDRKRFAIWQALEWGVIVWAAVCVLGLIFAGIAWARKESFPPYVKVGTALNAVLPLGLILFGLRIW